MSYSVFKFSVFHLLMAHLNYFSSLDLLTYFPGSFCMQIFIIISHFCGEEALKTFSFVFARKFNVSDNFLF